MNSPQEDDGEMPAWLKVLAADSTAYKPEVLYFKNVQILTDDRDALGSRGT